MQKIYLLYFILTLTCNYLLADSDKHGFVFKQKDSIIVINYDGTTKVIGIKNLINYVLVNKRIYIISSETRIQDGYRTGPSPKTNLLVYNFNPVTDSTFSNCKALNISDVTEMELSPLKNYLLVKTINDSLNCHYYIINTNNDSVNEIKLLKNWSVLNWCSNNELLCLKAVDYYKIISNEFFVYNIMQKKIVRHKLTIDLKGEIIFNGIRWNSSDMLLRFNYSLAMIGKVNSKIIDFRALYWYWVQDRDNIIILGRKSSKNLNVEIAKVNKKGILITRVNLSDIFKNPWLNRGMNTSENIVDGNIIVYSRTIDGKSNFYKINIKNFNKPQQIKLKTNDSYCPDRNVVQF